MAETGPKVRIDPGVRVLVEEAGILGVLADDRMKEGDRGVKRGLFTYSPPSFINCAWSPWYTVGFVLGMGYKQ